MNEPLGETIELLLALELIANGLSADYDDNGIPIAAVVRATMGRLREVERVWLGIMNAEGV
jgi:hypothetical protein